MIKKLFQMTKNIDSFFLVFTLKYHTRKKSPHSHPNSFAPRKLKIIQIRIRQNPTVRCGRGGRENETGRVSSWGENTTKLLLLSQKPHSNNFGISCLIRSCQSRCWWQILLPFVSPSSFVRVDYLVVTAPV